MLRSKAEVKQIATGIVHRIVSGWMVDFPRIRNTVDRLPKEDWAEALDEAIAAVEEILLTRFGSSE